MPTPPPWGWRPKKVANSFAYTDNPPPELSERCTYWLNRLRGGSWMLDERYPRNARQLGIWAWEHTHVLLPAVEMVRALRRLDKASRSDLRREQAALNEKERELRRKEREFDEVLDSNRQFLVTEILNHRGYHCTDPDCILECVQDVEDRQ